MTNGKPSMPRTTNRKKNRIAADDRADGLDAEPVGDAQVAGLPARASRFSVVSVNDAELVTRATEPDSRPASGRSVRSRNGCCSSSSSRFLACIGPELGQAGLDRVDRRVAGQPDDDQQDGAGRECGDEDREWASARPRCRRSCG